MMGNRVLRFLFFSVNIVLLNVGVRGVNLMSAPPKPLSSTDQNERTFVMLKPEGLQRGLMAEVLNRFERRGFKLVALKMLKPDKSLAEKHYEEHSGKPFFEKIVSNLSSGPVIAMVWEGKDAVKQARSMIGATNPLQSPPGTIRGDFALHSGRNFIHGSDSLTSAKREIGLWFMPSEVVDWTLVSSKFVYE